MHASTSTTDTITKKIFVNFSLQMEKIKFVGFDMDATLAIYNSPISEVTMFTMCAKRLVEHHGYPKELMDYSYDASFVVRCLWFDKRFGHLLKTDANGNILDAWHGFKQLKSAEIRTLYPNKHVLFDETRFFVLNTIFNAPETYMLVCLVDLFDNSNAYEKLSDGTGFSADSCVITYETMFKHSRAAVDFMHDEPFKTVVMANLNKFIAKDQRALPLMKKLRAAGKTVFLLTNSGWKYTDVLMTHIMGRRWRELFDIVIVDGSKPAWFTKDRPFKEVDVMTGRLMLGDYHGPLKKGHVYSGGSVSEFRKYVKLTGKDTLYVGDHILGDCLKSKKTGGWRTLLIIPELDHELQVFSSQQSRFRNLLTLNEKLGDVAGEATTSKTKRDEYLNTLKAINETTLAVERAYGEMGSLMRRGWRCTYFAGQMERFADLYTANVYNLCEYSGAHYFRATIRLLPHESDEADAELVNTKSSVACLQMSEPENVVEEIHKK